MRSSSHLRVLVLVLAAGFRFGSLPAARAQTAQPSPTAAASPAAADEKLATDMVTANTKERHLAPHDTFYLLNYVAVKTDKGVEGFDPGQEVHLVEVHRPTHTLVVTDGHAQVEVQPSQLTNDMDIAALVRQKDEASQARIAAHVQTEQKAYDKYERVAADATARDLAQRRQEEQAQADALRQQEQIPVAQTAPPVTTSGADVDGYYGSGGYGYGNPYSYFSNSSVVVAPGSNAAGTARAVGSGPSAGRGTNPATVGTAGRPAR